MKNLKIWSLAIALLMAMTGCEADTATDDFKAGNVKQMVNEWHLIAWDGDEAPYDLYVDFNEDNTFVLYQRIFTTDYEKYTGVYTLSNDKLTGMYDNGNALKNYRAEVSVDGKTMRLHSTEKGRDVVGVYEQVAIPEFVKAMAEGTRAAAAEPFL